MLTHGAVAASARATSARLRVDPSRHRWLACLPLNHIGGLSVVTRALLTGAPLDVLDGFDAGASGPGRARTSWSPWSPAALARLDGAPFYKVLLGGSAAAPVLPANVVTTYGMTETGSGLVYDGVPLDGVEVSVRSGEVRRRARCSCARTGTGPYLSTRRGGSRLATRARSMSVATSRSLAGCRT